MATSRQTKRLQRIVHEASVPHTSTYVHIRPHTSTYVHIRPPRSPAQYSCTLACIRSVKKSQAFWTMRLPVGQRTYAPHALMHIGMHSISKEESGVLDEEASSRSAHIYPPRHPAPPLMHIGMHLLGLTDST
jgi:hypothetical protein